MVLTETGRRYEHRVVMENATGRKLSHKEHVHHKNGDTLDNRLNNLELMSHSNHMLKHVAEKPRHANGTWR